jgi:hypothetical protein
VRGLALRVGGFQLLLKRTLWVNCVVLTCDDTWRRVFCVVARVTVFHSAGDLETAMAAAGAAWDSHAASSTTSNSNSNSSSAAAAAADIMCLVCFEASPAADTLALACAHRFCKGCWADFLRNAGNLWESK